MSKTVIVTGGARGIGFGCALQLGLDGYNVAIVATGDESRYEKKFSLLKKNNINYLYIKGNITSKKDRENIVKTTVEKYGSIEALVNCAGVAPLVRNDILDMTEESYDRVTGINTKGTLFMTQLVANQMLKQPIKDGIRGFIVNIGSCSAEVSSVSRGEYCISKAGVSMITTLFADRLAGEGIFVNEVRPGVIETELTAVVKDKYDKMIADGAFPIARWGYPKDVAGAVSFFCSDKCTYTTGNYIDVDGGFHIKRL